jgi:GNAT superfamily N-acetyltransferase
MTAPDIRALTPADHAAWLPLWRAYQVFYKVDLPDAATTALWSRLLDPAEPVHGALAWDGDTAVGLAQWLTHRSTWSVADLCYLNDLFVIPNLRGGGVGRRLIEYVYVWAEAAGCARVYWLTHDTNVTARALYDRVATRTGFIHYGHPLG